MEILPVAAGMSGAPTFIDMVESYERLIYSIVYHCCGRERYCQLHQQVRNQRSVLLEGDGSSGLQEAVELFKELASLRAVRVGGYNRGKMAERAFFSEDALCVRILPRGFTGAGDVRSGVSASGQRPLSLISGEEGASKDSSGSKEDN